MTHVLNHFDRPAAARNGGAASLGQWRKLVALGFLTTLLSVKPALAEQDSPPPQDKAPTIEFDFDDPTAANLPVTDSFSVGASLEFELEGESNFNLDDSDNEDVVTLEPTLSLAAAYEPVSYLRAFLEFELSRGFLLKDPGGTDPDTKLEVTEAYIALPDLLPGVTPTLGRMRFNDEREWLFDEDLDGARLVLRRDEFSVEAAVMREELLKKDLLGDHDDDEANNVYLRGYLPLGKESQASAYALYRDGRKRNSADNLLFIGSQSFGALTKSIEYWGEFAIVTGEEDGRDVLGFGTDLGVTHEWRDSRFRPAVTLGAAYGSGDDGKGTDRAFRQTGLQDNQARFNGVSKFAYYGELFDPELSNLVVLTAGVGVRPTKRSSVDLVYHNYLQPRRSDEIRDSAIDQDPSGRKRNIGQELDLIIGIREFDNVELEMVGAVFVPGAAFDDRDDLAFFGGLSLEVRF